MSKVFRIVLILLGLGVLAYITWYLYDKSQEKPIIYKTEQPAVDNIIQKTVATGSVVPRQEIEIKPRVSGIVDKLFLEPGDTVKKGDLLARIRIIPDMVNLNNAENRLGQAKIALEDAERNFDRQKKLLDNKVIAKADFERVEIALKTAKEEVKASENNLQLIKEGATQKSGETTNTLVRSTIAGMILDIPIEEGDAVIESNAFNEGTTIASIADMSELIFEGKVDESEVGKIDIGMDLILTIGAIEGEAFSAKLEYISPKGVEENGAIQFEIRAAVSLQESHFIRAGYSANADIVLNKRDSVLTVTEQLLLFEEDEVFVEVETAPQEFEKRKVEVGLSDGIRIEVLSGVSEGDVLKVQQ